MTKYILAFILLSVLSFSQLRPISSQPLTVSKNLLFNGGFVEGPQVATFSQSDQKGSRYTAVLTIDINGQTTTVTSSFVVAGLASCAYSKCYTGYVEYLELEGTRTQGYGSA
jgi:hypothetical protein